MTVPFILFFVFALTAIGGALLLILAREPIHSALSLILVMMSLAGLYLMLGAEFVAAVRAGREALTHVRRPSNAASVSAWRTESSIEPGRGN